MAMLGFRYAVEVGAINAKIPFHMDGRDGHSSIWRSSSILDGPLILLAGTLKVVEAKFPVRELQDLVESSGGWTASSASS